ncbi:TRAP transporter large permease [Desulfosporosinus sp.]|uniref:TRAP transporter large permease n=1 Tax=Desulfosporosinus sp. TaxID=157907 RepID=UPI000E818188|nr:TRAP transporter large permease [Desulfosporosinus sp.]MBC2722133.1 TRAP transporter large permease [Desulfosporosinus sp.]MBC2726494.1 TRAP transporter large permease [Desulfosporosinus sp.]HBV87474.1 C4-dicarboxylate ABC transporter permease [Desulfosporosinus sp.]
MTTLAVFLGLFFGLCLFLRVPAFIAMGIGAAGAFAYKDFPTSQMSQAIYNQLDSLPFLAIPMFILAGAVMEHGQISDALIKWIRFFIGRFRGALGLVTIIASAAFGVITGSAMATISAVGRIMGPSLEKNGYSKAYIGALLSSCGFLGIMIPPSIPGIMYGSASGESTSDVWISTIGAGLLFIVLYSIINYLKVGRFETKQEVPKLTPSKYVHAALVNTWSTLPALIMPIIIFGGIYSGVFTPTEAGAVSVVYGLAYIIIRLILRRSNTNAKVLTQSAIAAALSTGTVVIMAAFANAAGRVITLAGVSAAMTELVTTNIDNPYIYLLLVNLIFLFAGTFLEVNCAILILVPLLLPPAKALGIDPIHFGAITLVNLSVGNLTPPFAQGIFMASKVVGTSFVEIVSEIWPFLIASLCVIAVVTYYPPLSLFLVR